MRKLLYDCYCENVLVKTVATQKEAKEWKELHSKNFYKIRLEMIDTLQNFLRGIPFRPAKLDTTNLKIFYFF